MNLPAVPDYPHTHQGERTPSAGLTSGRFVTPGQWALVGVAFVLILAPMVALPIGPDEGMFFVSAQKILHQGAVHYRDIVDVKPPLIYHLYAASLSVLGDTDTAPRVLDLGLQLASVWLLVLLMRRRGFDDSTAIVAALLYALLYGGLGYADTMQSESYLALPVFGAMLLMTGSRTPWMLIVAGAVAATATLLKYPFAAVPLAVLLGDMLLWRRNTARNLALLCVGMLAPLVALVLYLTLGDAWTGFAEMNVFTAGYISTTGSGLFQLLRDILQWTPWVAGGVLSLVVFVATILGVGATLGRRDADRAGVGAVGASAPAAGALDVDRELSRLLVLRLATILLLAVFASLFMEGKYFPYQISRVFPLAAILAAQPLVNGWHWLRRIGGGWYSTPMKLILLGVAFLYGPLPSWLWSGALPAVLAVTSPRHYDAFYERMESAFPYRDLKVVGATIRGTAASTTETEQPDVVALSIVGALVHHAAGSIPRERIFHSAFLTAGFGPPTWREEMRARFRQRPRWIVVQRLDTAFQLTGGLLTSEALIDTLALRRTLDTAYVLARRTDHFLVYRRRDDVTRRSSLSPGARR